MGWELDPGPIISTSNLNQVFYEGESLRIIDACGGLFLAKDRAKLKAGGKTYLKTGFYNSHQSRFSDDSQVSLSTSPPFYTLEAGKREQLSDSSKDMQEARGTAQIAVLHLRTSFCLFIPGINYY